MEQEISQSEFTPRSGLNRTLQYRAHIRGLHFLCWLGAASFLSMGLFYASLLWAEQQPLDWVLLGIFILLLPAFLVLQARFNLRNYAYTLIHLRPDGVTLERPWDKNEFSFAEVIDVKVWHVPYLGGRFRFTLPEKRTFTFTVGIERSEYILESFLAARPGMIPMKDFLRLRRTAILTDHSWARLHDRFRLDYKRLLLLFVAMPSLAAAALLPISFSLSDGLPVSGVVLTICGVFALNFTMGLAAWGLVDLFLLYQGGLALEKNVSLVRRDLPYEKQVYRWSVIAHIAAFFVSLAAIAASVLLYS